MSEIVIRHATERLYAIRQIHAQPEVYHNTLQVPHPLSRCGKSGHPTSRALNSWSHVTSTAPLPDTCASPLRNARAAAMWLVLGSV